MKSLVPIRVDTQIKLTDAEKDCVAWHVLSGCSRNEAFTTFCRPELKGNKVVLTKVAAQFYGSEEVVSYMEAYTKMVARELDVQKKDRSYSAEEMKSRKEMAIQKLVNYVIEQSNNIEEVENKDDIIKFADKLGLLDNTDGYIESPRRYLPETCSQCRYKAFIEANCEEII